MYEEKNMENELAKAFLDDDDEVIDQKMEAWRKSFVDASDTEEMPYSHEREDGTADEDGVYATDEYDADGLETLSYGSGPEGCLVHDNRECVGADIFCSTLGKESDFSTANDCTEDLVTLSAGVSMENSPKRVTLHAPDTQKGLTDEETLSFYTPRILHSLRGSKRDLARVGASLCAAKNALSRGSNLSREQETTFTEWYQKKLGISQDQARLWMRWVRPVLNIVDWEDNDDPILKEIASIGPHLFDEVTKLPENCWFMSDEGILFVAAAATGDKDTPVKDLSVRKVKAIRDRLNGVDEDNAVDDTDSDSLIVGDDDLIEESAEGNLLDDSDSGSDSEFDDDADRDEEDEDDGGDENTNARSNTKFDADIKSSINLSKKKTAKAKGKTKISQKINLDDLLNADDWSHKDFQPFKLPVLFGKTEGENPMLVSGINVKIARESNALVHAVVDDTQDAFYAVKTGTGISLHWYERRENQWHVATATNAGLEHEECDEPVVEAQESPLEEDDLTTDLRDFDTYRYEGDTLLLPEQFDACVEEDTVV